MNSALLDVNVLVALFDPAHPHHEDAHAWFGKHRRNGWATCPLTINGCVRVLSSPSYPSFDVAPAEVITRLSSLCSSPDHESWPDSVSLLDITLFRPGLISGSKAITDVYLLGLAVRNNGKLITFDRSMNLKAVVKATRDHLYVLGGKPA